MALRPRLEGRMGRNIGSRRCEGRGSHGGRASCTARLRLRRRRDAQRGRERARRVGDGSFGHTERDRQPLGEGNGAAEEAGGGRPSGRPRSAPAHRSRQSRLSLLPFAGELRCRCCCRPTRIARHEGKVGSGGVRALRSQAGDGVSRLAGNAFARRRDAKRADADGRRR